MSDTAPLTRAQALLYLAKILPVWPGDYEVVKAINLKETGWVFGKCHDDMVYVDRSGLYNPISEADWKAACVQRYGKGNGDDTLLDDGEFLRANMAAIAEKGDDLPDEVDVTADGLLEDATRVECEVGHIYIALEDHPLDEKGLPHCPHCMAEILAYIGGFRVKG